MMSSFTMLKKNSRFKSACPSSGPVTFCEGGPGHVHTRSPRGLTRGFLHQPCARIKSRIASTCPSSGPATFCEGSRPRLRTQSGHVHARNPATSTHAAAASTHAAFVAPTCAIFSPPQPGYLLQLSDCTRRRPSGSVGTKHFLGPPLPLGLYRRYLWVSRHQTLSWASLPLGLYFSAGCISGRLH